MACEREESIETWRDGCLQEEKLLLGKIHVSETCKLGEERTSFAEKMQFAGYMGCLWATEEQCPAEGASQRLLYQNCEKLEEKNVSRNEDSTAPCTMCIIL